MLKVRTLQGMLVWRFHGFSPTRLTFFPDTFWCFFSQIELFSFKRIAQLSGKKIKMRVNHDSPGPFHFLLKREKNDSRKRLLFFGKKFTSWLSETFDGTILDWNKRFFSLFFNPPNSKVFRGYTQKKMLMCLWTETPLDFNWASASFRKNGTVSRWLGLAQGLKSLRFVIETPLWGLVYHKSDQAPFWC